MKPKYSLLVLGLITSVISGVLLPSSVNAVSIYDDVIVQPSQLTISYDSYAVDVTDWRTFISSTNSNCSTSHASYIDLTDILNNPSSGTYSVSQRTIIQSSITQKNILITYNKSATRTATFYENVQSSGIKSLRHNTSGTTDVGRIILSVTSTNVISCYQSGNANISSFYISNNSSGSTTFYDTQLYETNIATITNPGYQGISLPLSPPTPNFDYDSYLVTTSDLVLNDGEDVLDITTNYISVLTTYCTTTSQIEHLAEFVDVIQQQYTFNAYAINTGYSIVDDMTTVYFQYTSNDTATIDFDENVGIAPTYHDGPNPSGLISLTLSDDNVYCNSYDNGSFTLSKPDTVGNSSVIYSLFLANGYDINYPSDYDGELIPDTAPLKPELLRPDFIAQISNKNIISHDYNSSLPSFTPDQGYTFISFEIEWSLWQCVNSFDDITGMCDEHVLINYDILPQDSDYTYQVQDYGDYVLEAEYQVQQCYRYPSYPTTPDYCFYSDLSAILPDYDAVATTKHLLIDGSSYTVDTKELLCNAAGYCQEAENICYDQPDFMSRLQCEFSKQMTVGIINPSLQSVKSLLTSLTVSDNPQCIIPFGDVTYIGETIPLSTFDDSACSFTEDVHSAIPLLSVVTNFILALSLFSMVIAIINKLTDEKNHNMIEGL